jgi:hypothetical protein
MHKYISKIFKPCLVLGIFFMVLLAAPGLTYASQDSETESSSTDVETSESSAPVSDETVNEDSSATETDL